MIFTEPWPQMIKRVRKTACMIYSKNMPSSVLPVKLVKFCEKHQIQEVSYSKDNWLAMFLKNCWLVMGKGTETTVPLQISIM